MITSPLLQWLFTALFVAVAGYFAWRAAKAATRAVELTEHLLHVAMAVVMAAMVWPWWGSWPWAPQLVFFMGATSWFLLMLLLQVTGAVPPGRHGTFAVWYQAIHTVMMAAMVWMVAVMPPVDPTAHAAPGGHGSHSGEQAAAMAGMSPFAFWSGTVLTVLMFAAALVEGVALMRRTTEEPSEHHPHVEAGAVVAMLLGMGGLCVAMLRG